MARSIRRQVFNFKYRSLDLTGYEIVKERLELGKSQYVYRVLPHQEDGSHLDIDSSCRAMLAATAPQLGSADASMLDGRTDAVGKHMDALAASFQMRASYRAVSSAPVAEVPAPTETSPPPATESPGDAATVSTQLEALAMSFRVRRRSPTRPF